MGIPTFWRRELSATKEVALKVFGDSVISIYLRGSVARGYAKRNYSDIDIVILTARLPDRERLSKERAFEAVLRKNSTIKHRVDFEVEEMEAFIKNESFALLRFLVKTSGIRIFGKGILGQLPVFHLNSDIQFYSKSLSSDVAFFCKNITHHSLEKKADLMRWLSKRVIRVAGESATASTRRYSRDLWYCYTNYVSVMPKAKPALHRMLGYALSTKPPLRRFLEDLRVVLAFLEMPMSCVK